uniref:Poly [ADP-ribose] polymerase n=1 Tax=Seriola lalandi dorsalis TaxID=1841481 RepID=A0A3B4WTB6_SERLL
MKHKITLLCNNIPILLNSNTLVASYSLCDGLQVLVCQGDITKQDADALVNAANEDLDHCGGVAAALSKAGGPEIQRESNAVVKYIGKIPTGDVVVTTGGKLNCKTLLHAVGPAAGRAGGRERFLLEKTVQSALNLSEIMELTSIAMPCISSGVFGVPLTVCSEAIVTAVKRFGSQGGRSLILSVAHSQKCLIQCQEQNLASGTRLSNRGTLVASYSLCDGLQVLVCQGDITKQDADALVNAANEDLDHCGGVAAALSKAGGPEIQRESNALVKQIGKIPTGDVVVTTGGKLNCKTLLHAVGPAAGRAGGRERFLLEKTVQSALNMAEIMEFKSIAMPCISSGVFGVPLTVCSEAIVTAVKRFGSQGGRSLSRIILIDNRGEVVRAICMTSTSALELPAQWEPMHEEVFKKVELQINSQEYQDVAQGFLKTAKYNIQKIERVQNLYLWHAYTVCRQRILGKNGRAELGEKSLYHGTSAESCNCIERDRFDRSFAGAHAAMYGKGVYFAVNADYSASRYSPADTSGLRRLYVARVLTGRYTVGNSSMKAPPPRGSDPTDCFDSLVNNQQQPSMFVIFHDDQAYPEYLITFN